MVMKTWFEDGDERFMVAAVVLCEGCLAVPEAGGVWFREVCKNRGARLHLLVLSLMWVSSFFILRLSHSFTVIRANTTVKHRRN